MEIIGDAEGLVREVRELARRESGEIIAAAEAEAERLLAAAQEAADKEGAAFAAGALAEAERRRAMLLASVPAEAARLRAERIEAVLETVKAGALRRLEAEYGGAGSGAALAALAASAVAKMEGNSFVLTLGPAAAAALKGRAGDIERAAGKGALDLVFEEDAAIGDGVLVRDAAGRQFWDNTFRARLERLWPELRGSLMQSLEMTGEGQ
ncbi:MAG TPA: V-type ATP synthase subunit E family protein [Elusimicrobiales bacterium]|nr:V-type ATP synthase subunit E family protein [Elusimicrobiales bacterium]